MLNKYSLVNLFIAFLITIVVVFINGALGNGGTASGVVISALSSILISSALEVTLVLKGRKTLCGVITYAVELAVCIVGSLLSLLVV